MKKYQVLFLLAVLFFVAHYARGGDQVYQFKPFQYNDQLPSNSVQCVYKDKDGFVWFGTRDGLCRFDGYRIKVVRSNTVNHNKLTNNNIRCIVEDNRHRLWIGTNEGINILDKTNNSIRPFNNAVIGRDRITDMCLDRKGNLWIATSGRGIVRVDSEGHVHVYQKSSNNSKIPSNNGITVYVDSQDRVWATFWTGGLALYRPDHDDFKPFPRIGKENNPFKILEDRDHDFWICTWGDGMFSFNPHNYHQPYTPVTFLKDGKPFKMSNIIYRMIQDSERGHMWIISFLGLDILQKKGHAAFDVITFKSMFKEPGSKLFHEIVDDHSGSLWLGSVGEGVYKLYFKDNNFKTNDLDLLTKKLGFFPNVYHLCEAGEDMIYLVIDRLGIYTLQKSSGDLKKVSVSNFSEKENVQVMNYIKSMRAVWFVKENGSDICVLKINSDQRQSGLSVIQVDPHNQSSINCLYEDRAGDVWIGFEQGLYKRTLNGKITLISNKIVNIVSLSGDEKGNIWVGTERQGAFRVRTNVSNGSVSKIDNFSDQTGNLQSNSVQAVCCSKSGNVYMGSREGCIYQYSQSAGAITDISYKYGITEDAILDIIEDNYGMLWISTTKKIIRYNPLNHVSTYYTDKDGILVSSFSKNAAAKLHNGEIVFGGNKGFCAFTPTLTNQAYKSRAKVKITGIDVNNQSVFDNNGESKFNYATNTLILYPNDNNVSLEFSSLDYSFADKIQYAYRLIGIDADWVYPGSNRRYVNYTNLPSGKYTFEVKATDENGQWSDQISVLTLVKKPPFYLTYWAYFLYLILIVILIRVLVNRVRLRHELRISRIEKEKSEELTQTKLRYFTGISHDLLTPLTIILLLAEELESKLSALEKIQAAQVKTNANRLKRLIHQILAFRKIETGNMKLQIQQSDVVAFVREVCYVNFQPMITEKHIRFEIKSDYDCFDGWFDRDKLDKILYNLLSNAFKFTPDGGQIRVALEFMVSGEITFLRLSVSDTGIGIREEDLPRIFSRFYISRSSDQSKSNGIGLSLVKELTEIHHGEVTVDSQLHKGSAFAVKIAVSRGAYLSDDFYEKSNENDVEGLDMLSEPDCDSPISCSPVARRLDYSVLVVEDNKELNDLIVSRFQSLFNVYTAHNGIRALQILREQVVDIVISDVMMPEMDGIELCKAIKGDVQTSHIAVLLLTAKISIEDQIDYFNAGAEAYMPKPFDLNVLAARVNNLIKRRELAVSSFKENKNIEVSALNYGSIDEEFLKKAIAKVEANMNDVNFDFDKFAESMHSSKSTLHRKLKSLTGLSPGEFIRNVRLKHACKMLISNNNPIAEIAYEAGFNDPKYFSRSFKAEFHISPSEYREQNQNL